MEVLHDMFPRAGELGTVFGTIIGLTLGLGYIAFDLIKQRIDG